MNTPGKPKPSRWQRSGLLIALGIAVLAVLFMLFARW